MGCRFFQIIAAFVFFFMSSGLAFAQTGPAIPAVEREKLQGAESRLTAFGSDLLGDGIDPHTGSISFQTTDVSIPGNFGLPVAITRKISGGDFYKRNQSLEFGDWQIDVPRLHVLTGSGTLWTGNRCTNTFDQSFPPHPKAGGAMWRRADYTNGLVMDIPGQSSKTVLEQTQTNTNLWPSGTEMVTVDGWRLSCYTIPGGGQGFIGHAPDGTQYRFDKFMTFEAPTLGARASGPSDSMARRRNILAATLVTDINGNTVDYNYDGSGRLTSIESSDDRIINLSYSGTSTLIQSVTANPNSTDARSWSYTYATKTVNEENSVARGPVVSSLISVTQPDDLSWAYDFGGMSVPPAPSGDCFHPTQTLTATHPHGVTGTFVLGERFHRTSLQLQELRINGCLDPGAGGQPTLRMKYAKVMSVSSKTLTAPDIDEQEWTYLYEYDAGPANTDQDSGTPGAAKTNTTTVTEPTGRRMVYRHYWSAELLGGKLAYKEVQDSSHNVVRRQDYTYEQEGGYGGGAASSNTTPFYLRAPTHTKVVETLQDGDTYTTEAYFNTDQSNTDYSYSSPVQTQVYSSASISTAPRITDIDYIHDKTQWIIGLVDTITVNGRLTSDYDYDGLGRLSEYKKYGQSQGIFTYHSDGTIDSVTDALSRTSLADDWHRGKVGTITRPDKYVGTTENVVETQEIDDNGWVTKSWDARGYLERLNGGVLEDGVWFTTYQYDDMGRLEYITPPNITPGIDWADTEIEYDFAGGGAVQTITKGNSEVEITYDSMFRPITEKTTAKAINDPNQNLIPEWVSYVRTEYDALGRVKYQYLPADNMFETRRSYTEYDALGRITERGDDYGFDLPTLYTYLDGHRTWVRDPEHNITITTRYGYDGPITGSGGGGDIYRIIQPEGIYTTMFRNIHGEVERVLQSELGGVSAEQLYFYDDQRRLCKHRTPEGGDTLYAYDAAGQMTLYAKGQPNGSSVCLSPNTAGNARVRQTYDEMGRPKLTDFTDPATPDIRRVYNANGQPTLISRGVGDYAPRRYYGYDELGNMLYEDLLVGPDFSTDYYMVDYAYNADGHRRYIRYPSLREVHLRPDGMGRLTRARQTDDYYGSGNTVQEYVQLGQYFPNGSIEKFFYGNGLLHSRALDIHQRTQRQWISHGGTYAMDVNYYYDNNGRVTDHVDNRDNNQNRLYGYDGAGRLVSATGPWGVGTGGNPANVTASYTYDGLGNILTKSMDQRMVSLTYDSGPNGTNRLLSSDDNGNWWGDPTGQNTGLRNFSYDTRGNVTGLGSMTFTYDMTDQPVTVGGTKDGQSLNETYVYDGNLKRVKAVTGGETIYSVFASGALIHTDNRTTGVTTDYIAGPLGQAARVKRTGGLPGTDAVTFLHNDHLGSASSATDINKLELWTESYTPYGESLVNASANDNQPGFTGHIKDTATGLNYMQARYFDPVAPRFLSVDPVTFMQSGLPGMFNRYAYANNDPVNMIDSTGLQFSPYHGAISLGNHQRIQNSENPTATAGQIAHEATVNAKISGGAALTLGAAYGGAYAYSALGPVAFAEGLAGFVPGMEGATLTGSLGAAATITAGQGRFSDALSNTLSRVTSGGDNLLEVTIPTAAGDIGVLAEVIIKGDNLTLDNVAIYGVNGDIAPGNALKELLNARSELAQAAGDAGFNTVTVTGARSSQSSTAREGAREITISTCRGSKLGNQGSGSIC